jgi:uncharacterized membrane protein YbhN (UPF0104 family)
LPPKALRALLRLLAALALMAVAVWIVGPERLMRQWTHIDRTWFLAAVAAAALAQAVSVLRWGTIARIFGLRVRLRALALAYAQGMTLNILLPGATLSGDALRSIRLQGLGNPLGVSALTVLLDRLSGLWVLCALSLITGLALTLALGAGALGGAVLVQAGPAGTASWVDPALLVWVYLAGLAALCAIPWLPLRGRPPPAAGGAGGWLARAWRRLGELHDLAIAQRRPLGRSLWSSVLVQVLCALTLWLCVLAAGGHAGYWQVQAVAAPVFVAGALPLSYGGFGARELAALAAFPLVGVPGDVGLAASVLYGVVAVVLGLAAAPSFAVVGLRAPVAPGS